MHDIDPLHNALKSLENMRPATPPEGLKERILHRAKTTGRPRIVPLQRVWLAAAAVALLLVVNVSLANSYFSASPVSNEQTGFVSAESLVGDFQLYEP